MTSEQSLAIKQLRESGYAVTIFNPTELRGVNPIAVEGQVVELTWDVIESLVDADPED